MDRSLLAPGERVVFRAHAHWKNLVVPVLLSLVASAAAVAVLLWVLPSPDRYSAARWVVLGMAAAVVLMFGLGPFLAWWTSTDTLTTRRLVSRRGVLAREGKDIPIDRVHSVAYRQSLLDRVLGCGTLVVQTAGSDSDVELHDVARIERRMLQLQEVMLGDEIPAEGADDRSP